MNRKLNLLILVQAIVTGNLIVSVGKFRPKLEFIF